MAREVLPTQPWSSDQGPSSASTKATATTVGTQLINLFYSISGIIIVFLCSLQMSKTWYIGLAKEVVQEL